MKFKVRKNDIQKHSEIVNDIAWTISNELYRLGSIRLKYLDLPVFWLFSISDDNIVYKWDCNSF